MSAPLDFVTASPRWDRNRVLFEIEDGGRAVACAISVQAIQDASGRRFHDKTRLLDCFSKIRPRVERIALEKLRARPHAGENLLTVWSGDLDE
ncbi:MAG: DUF1488 family protein [Rhodospirillales bacterium]|nr:DUF1488 family protein [Rhodospirillales bacterium]